MPIRGKRALGSQQRAHHGSPSAPPPHRHTTRNLSNHAAVRVTEFRRQTNRERNGSLTKRGHGRSARKARTKLARPSRCSPVSAYHVRRCAHAAGGQCCREIGGPRARRWRTNGAASRHRHTGGAGPWGGRPSGARTAPRTDVTAELGGQAPAAAIPGGGGCAQTGVGGVGGGSPGVMAGLTQVHKTEQLYQHVPRPSYHRHTKENYTASHASWRIRETVRFTRRRDVAITCFR
jgi:hypothetical protein